MMKSKDSGSESSQKRNSICQTAEMPRQRLSSTRFSQTEEDFCSRRSSMREQQKIEESKMDPAQLEALKFDRKLQTLVVSDLLLLEELKNQFTSQETQFRKLVFVEKSFSKYRTIKSDGSCFYRAYLYRILEDRILNEKSDIFAQFQRKLEESFAFLLKAGFEKSDVQEMHDVSSEAIPMLMKPI